jgi:ABC-type transport system involved in multi-copper enzyme maturation permease subunit
LWTERKFQELNTVALHGSHRLFIGPVFTREATVAPRRASFYAARTIFVAALFGMVLTAWQLLIGSQRIENPGDLAWFGAAVLQILAPVQFAVAIPFSALLVASAVALEKDRKTFVLMLMTNLSNTELVLGKLLAGMLTVVMVVVAAAPLLMLLTLLGGVSSGQILRIEAVTLASALVAGSLGSTIALWREKTFQTLAITALVIVLWLVAWELVAAGAFGRSLLGVSVESWALTMSPWRAIMASTQSSFGGENAGRLVFGSVGSFLAVALAGAALLNAFAILMVRRWNPTREAAITAPDERDDVAAVVQSTQVGANEPRQNVHSAGGKVRPVWDNPILWREIRTWAYGKKILLVRIAYWAVFLVCVAVLVTSGGETTANPSGQMPSSVQPLIALSVVSLVLLNAAAVTALTNERDAKALDLLLVTDLSPKEIVFGKLGGAFYNAKEMVLFPPLLFAFLWYTNRLPTDSFLYLCVGWCVIAAFAAMLGLHSGITYANSRTAIATSLGTLMFLFLGVATCMRIMLAFSSSFEYQLTSFLGFIAGGSVGLFVALGWRNPSRAIFLASLIAPFATFYVITSYFLGKYDSAFFVICATYGFATAAMLVPAVSEFDIALGRTSEREG